MVENKASNNKENEKPTLQTLFQEAARKYPHKTAAIFDDGETVSMVTYAEMQKRADEVAVYLEQLHLQGEVIGLYYHASLTLPTLLLGILQTPAVFAPIDPHAPSNINEFFIKELNIRMVLVQEEVIQRFLDTIGSTLSVRVVQFLSDHGLVVVEIQHQPPDNAESPLPRKPLSSSESLAYVIHTSGTTGTPKIVSVPHSCILPNVLHLREIFKIGPGDTTFMASPLTFDPSIVEIFMTLSQGATLVIVPMVIKLMPRVLANILKKHHVTVLQATPTLISRFGQDLLQSHLLHAKSTLRVLAFGGEICPTPSVIKQWRGNGNKTEFYNVYGVTELSSWATYYKIPESDIVQGSTDSVPLGVPLLDTEVEVHDQEGRIIHGVGREGELFIGGKRQCFIDGKDNVSMETMRATGDIVKVTEKGLVYIGRHDNQIKRHGKRINLSQIQQLAETMDMIECCAVIQDKHGRLVMCAVVSQQLHYQGKMQQENIIRSQLREFLPDHGIPDELVVVEKLPITTHGKVDSMKLTKIIEERDLEGDIPSFDKQHIQQLWQSALGISYPIEEYSRFLQEGGNSISAIYFTESIESWVKQNIPELLDVVLHKAFHDVCLLIEETLLNHRNTNLSKQHGRQKKKAKVERSLRETDRQKSDAEEVEFKVKKMRMNGHVVMAIDEDRREDTSLYSASDVKKEIRDERITAKYSMDSLTDLHSDWLAISRGSYMMASHGEMTVMSWNISSGEVVRGVARGNQIILEKTWKCDTGQCVDASPLLVLNKTGSGTVYIGSHSHKFMAISTLTGEALWVTELGDRVESSACLSRCGQYVVVGCYDGKVYILDCKTGEIYWQYQTDDAVKSSPVVDTVTSWVIVGSHDHHLHAINIQEKSCAWRLYGGGGSMFSSPVIINNPRVLYAATLTGRLLAVDPDTGFKKWHFDSYKPIFSSPAVTQHGCIFGCVDGRVHYLDHHGNQLWSFTTQGPVFSSPCTFPSAGSHDVLLANECAVFGSHDSHVYCLSIKTGEVQWQFKTPSEVYATPFIFRSPFLNQNLRCKSPQQETSQGSPARMLKSSSFVEDDSSPDLYVVVGCTVGTIFILHLYTGQLVSQYTLPGEVFSSPVVHGNRIIVGCRDDNVYCFEMASE
ncbi:beta-alanine-activating enzyme-like [Glandiceps talaboti]